MERIVSASHGLQTAGRKIRSLGQKATLQIIILCLLQIDRCRSN